MATKINQIKNRIMADDQTKSSFQSAGRNATKYARISLRASDIAMRGFIATGVAITAVVTASAAVVAGSFALTQRMAASEDQAGKMAQRIGVSVESLTQLQHAAELTGVATTTLNTALQRQTRRVAEAAQGTGEAKAALIELGLSAENLARLSPDKQFMEIAGAMENVSTSGDKVRLAMKLWDTEGVALLQTINGGAEALRLMKEEADLLGLTITGESAASAAAFNDDLLRLQSTATGMVRLFTEQLKPIFTVVFQEARKAMLDNREAAEDLAASIQDRIIKGLKIALEVMRFFHNAWLGIKLVGTAAMTGISVALEALLDGLRTLLSPLDLIFKGLVAIGEIDVNPFDSMQNGLADFTAASADQTGQIMDDIIATNAAYDTVGATIDGLGAKIDAQREANRAAGQALSTPGVADPRVEQERLTQEQLSEIRVEAAFQELEFERQMDENFAAIHEDQMARKHAEIALEQRAAQAKRTAINSALGNLATIARAGNASFETQKKISIAQGLVGTYQATIDAYKSAGNPYLGAVLAALAFAANIAQVNAIRRTKPGSSSTAGSPSGGALPSASAGLPAAPAEPLPDTVQTQQTTLILQIEGDLDPDMFTAKLMPSINKFAERGTFPQVQIQGAS